MIRILKSIKALLEGLFTVVKHLFKKSVTLQYPEERPVLPARFRGGHTLNGCIGCGICRQVCPCNAITIKKDEKKVTSYTINLRRCMFCGNCQYYCPVGAIKMGTNFEPAADCNNDLLKELITNNESGVDKQ